MHGRRSSADIADGTSSGCNFYHHGDASDRGGVDSYCHQSSHWAIAGSELRMQLRVPGSGIQGFLVFRV